jgi:hypothetical protein
MDPATPPPQLVYSSNSVSRTLFTTIAVVLLASSAGQISRYVFDHGNLFGVVRLLYVDEEQSIPAYFSSLQLLLAAALLGGIARIKWRERAANAAHWTVLAAGFLYLSIDENCSIHEFLANRLTAVKPTGIFYFAWVVPAGIATVAVAFSFLPFLARLPADTRREFIIAGLLFVGGAIGVEMAGGNYAEEHGYRNLSYASLATLEESLEMFGIAVFVRALLRYIERTHGAVVLILGRSTARRPASVADATPLLAGRSAGS